ncbi:SAM-dependent methyltransferase [Thalassobaculum sp.]|uniref:siroheme synthase family protein n=1 Tax=Thalassobaculum sp. TaxID=2022740 RepID=UPI0032ECABCC
MNGFPAFLRLAGQPVLVVGGGEAAVAKTRLLLAAGADVTVAAGAPARELLEWARDGRVTIDRRRPTADAVAGRAVVIVAEPDADGVAVAAAARAARVPVNVVDRPALSTFIMPAIIDRDPVLIAVSTGGSSPALARRVRAWIEALLPARLGALARVLDAARQAVNETLESAPVRRRFWDSVLDGPIATRILRGDEAGCSQVLGQLAAQDRGQPAGVVHIVGAGPGDPDLLTLKALRLLQQADVVIHDREIDGEVLAYARRDATRIAVGKARGAQSWSQAEIDALLVHRAREGQRVVRLRSGPATARHEAAHLRVHGIEVEIVPGVAASGTAPAASAPRTLSVAS